MTKHSQSRSRIAAFHHAFAGLGYVLRTQRNAWLHAVATFLVIIIGTWLDIDRLEWAIMLLAIGLVWLAEFLNTALEAVVDLASPETHPMARVGKDVGAAAVLIAATAAAITGLLVLGPPLIDKLTGR